MGADEMNINDIKAANIAEHGKGAEEGVRINILVNHRQACNHACMHAPQVPHKLASKNVSSLCC